MVTLQAKNQMGKPSSQPIGLTADEPGDATKPGYRAPISLKGKQQIGAVPRRKRSIETQGAPLQMLGDSVACNVRASRARPSALPSRIQCRRLYL